MRKIVKIDADRCNGCGLCIPNCAEGAIAIVDGKARLLAENLCDGLGACLGHCPMDAITIEERPADDFDEAAVRQHLAPPAAPPKPAHSGHGGCPGSRLRMMRPSKPAAATAVAEDARPSRLAQWPVQLALLPVSGPIWQNADVLIAADCVAYAVADFHERLLAGKTLAIACPKLDDTLAYVEKLAAIFAGNTIRSITIAHMEVPCCGGIVRAVHAAMAQAGRQIPLHDITVGIDGSIEG
jgi:NAD-dependent dihydropyrimidine dehydrogenase PreA subunit